MHGLQYRCIYRVALAVVILTTLQPSSAEPAQFSGVATRGNLSVWRANHQSGAVSLCSFEGHANRPDCYPWSVNEPIGKFEIIPGDDVLSTWRINVTTGEVSLCEYDDISVPPVCTPWSKN